MEPRREAESHELSTPRPLGAAATSTSREPSLGRCPGHLPLCMAWAESSQGTASLGLPLKPRGWRWEGGGVLPECSPSAQQPARALRRRRQGTSQPLAPLPTCVPSLPGTHTAAAELEAHAGEQLQPRLVPSGALPAGQSLPTEQKGPTQRNKHPQVAACRARPGSWWQCQAPGCCFLLHFPSRGLLFRARREGGSPPCSP